MTSPKQDIARVVMLWPADLKAEIQAEVGKRGLTAYVLDAVREKRRVRVAPPSRTTPEDVVTPQEGLQDGVAPPVAHTGHTCQTCGIELLGDEACWVCGG